MTPTEQKAYDTILAQNKWIEEAKPLLERGGRFEREHAALTARVAQLEGALRDVLYAQTHYDHCVMTWSSAQEDFKSDDSRRIEAGRNHIDAFTANVKARNAARALLQP